MGRTGRGCSAGFAGMQRSLLRWYRSHGRAALPWRTERSPYRTVVSEFMLAQTQVDRVVPKFEAFVERFPNFTALSRASLAGVLREWKGLGYNSRAVRLHGLARAVVASHRGALPSDPGSLRSLPGIGPYTVAAIRAFAFNEDDAPVDTNVRRIVHRVFFGIEHVNAASARTLDERARALVPPGRAHDWSSAMMDLGGAVCTARAPKCLLCPLQADCAAAPVDAESPVQNALRRRTRYRSSRAGATRAGESSTVCASCLPANAFHCSICIPPCRPSPPGRLRIFESSWRRSKKTA